MDGAGSWFRRAVGRLRWGRPEYLWVYSCAALVLVLATLITGTLISRSAIGIVTTGTQAIDASFQQISILEELQGIYAQNGPMDVAQIAQVAGLVSEFEKLHQYLLGQPIWSSDLQAQYFLEPASLNSHVEAIIDSLRNVATLDDAPFGSVDVSRTVYDLAAVGQMLEKEMVRRVTAFGGVKKVISMGTMATLLVMAVVIFVPAHLNVMAVMKQLMHRTEVLGNSQKQLRTLNEKLNYMVNHDQLTGLPNRSCMMTRLAGITANDQRPELGLLFIGLDNFKAINDTVGHAVGDEILIAVGSVLKSCVNEDDMVARVGGDEFVLMTTELPETLVKRISASLADPIDLGQRTIHVTLSVGFITAELGGYNPEQIIANADIALQAAKIDGGNRAQGFTPELRAELEVLLQLQQELPAAIEDGQIEPWFQPQVSLSTGLLHGAEVLARWRHPTRGLLTPDKFLPAAERAGLTVDVDHAVWESALSYACLWQREEIWRPHISLNAAPDTISDPYLIERLLLKLQRTGLEMDQVVVEVLETTLIDSSEDMAAINIDSLAECGISLELDDFGTGYASLSKLTQLPLAGIKLDRSLVAPLPDTAADSVVRAILALAGELGLKVVAEGIEETEQADHLQERGCDFGQGYGFAKPMPPDDFQDWLAENAKKVHTAGVTGVCVAQRA